jgi:aspartyl-tRNA(Asn)/glutamyl-tRNA(Gln) amidotransferase subunit A
MARSVADVAALFAALLGVDPADPLSVALPAMRDAGAPRIAFAPRLGLDVPVDADVAAAVDGAAARLAEAGFTIVRAEPAWPDGASERALMPLQWDGLARLHGDAWRRDPALFDPDIAAQIARGLAQPAADVAAARAMAAAIARAAHLFFARHDIVVGPTTPCVAWRHERLGPAEIDGRPVDDRAHAAFTPFFNHALASAISIPCGVDRRGLPIGLQIAGPRFADRRVLALAGDAERLLAA